MSSRIKISQSQNECPYCKAVVDTSQAHKVCQNCLTRHHEECWDAYSGCAVFGCGGKESLMASGSHAPVRTVSSQSAPRPTRSTAPVPAPTLGAPVRPRGSGAGLAIFVSLALAVGIGGAVFFSVSKKGGFFGPKSWDGKKTLHCAKARYRIENKRIDLGKKTAIYASNGCRLELRNVTLSARHVLYVSGNARVTISGGALVAESGILHASGNARVVITGTKMYGSEGIGSYGNSTVRLNSVTVEVSNYALRIAGNSRLYVDKKSVLKGQVYRANTARIYGLPEHEQKQTEDSLQARYGRGACNGVLACFTQHRQFGHINIKLVGHVGAGGKVLAAYVAESNATPAVEQCAVQAMRAQSIVGYTGKLGQRTCQIAGTYLETGVQMLSTTESFVFSPNQ